MVAETHVLEKENYKMKRIILFICLTFSWFCFEAKSKSGGEHITDMFMVYPFYAGSDTPFELFYKSIQGTIDYRVFNPNNLDPQTGNPLFLYEEPFVNTRWGNHRIWYHWGFNADPKRYKPLTDLVDRNIREGRMTEEAKFLFYEKLINEWSYRNRELMKMAAKILGYDYNSLSSAMRDQVNAFVTIPYSVHLIGDHFEDQKEKEIILQLDWVVKDIYDAIFKLSGPAADNRNKAKDLISKLKPYEHSPERFLEAMKDHFSPFLLSLDGPLYDYKMKFRRLQYKPRPGTNYRF